jgi:hypothetical protein
MPDGRLRAGFIFVIHTLDEGFSLLRTTIVHNHDYW